MAFWGLPPTSKLGVGRCPDTGRRLGISWGAKLGVGWRHIWVWGFCDEWQKKDCLLSPPLKFWDREETMEVQMTKRIN